MKKITLLFFALILAEANAQVDDVSPNLSNNSFPNIALYLIHTLPNFYMILEVRLVHKEMQAFYF
jgi:hypothetical protein